MLSGGMEVELACETVLPTAGGAAGAAAGSATGAGDEGLSQLVKKSSSSGFDSGLVAICVPGTKTFPGSLSSLASVVEATNNPLCLIFVNSLCEFFSVESSDIRVVFGFDI